MASEEIVAPITLSVTHVFDGECVVTGGDDGQVWVATFCSQAAAHAFVTHSVHCAKSWRGIRNEVRK